VGTAADDVLLCPADGAVELDAPRRRDHHRQKPMRVGDVHGDENLASLENDFYSRPVPHRVIVDAASLGEFVEEERVEKDEVRLGPYGLRK